MQDDRRPPEFLRAGEAGVHECLARTTPLGPRVYREHPDPGFPRLQELGPRRGRVRDEGDAAKKVTVAIQGHQDLGLAGAALDIGELFGVLVGEMAAGQPAVRGDDQFPATPVLPGLNHSDLHTASHWDHRHDVPDIGPVPSPTHWWQHRIMTKGAVLTTGANSGIGLHTAIELAKRGYRSIGTVRNAEKADVLLKAAADAGVTVEAELLDVTDAAACAELLRDRDLYGLVNNAGYSNTGAVEDTSDDDARRQLETMTIAPMRLARLALPAMRSNGSGRIVNVSSIYGRTTTPLTGWYQACKHALEAVSDALRVEVASSGVKVILVEPGGFRTGIWEDNQEALARHEGSRFTGAYERELLLTRLAQPFMGHPSQVARVIGQAVSSSVPRARYLVGYDARILALIEQTTPTFVKDTVTRLGLGL